MSLRSRRGRPRHRPRKLTFVSGIAAGLLGMSLLAACGDSGPTPGGGGAAPGASARASVLAGANCKSSSGTQLTFWAWVPGMNRAVDQFNRTHPNICVTLENPGAGLPTYQALNNAIKAGSGAPDVAEIEFAELASFEVQKQLVDLSKYGAADQQSKFVPWAWQQVTRGSAILAMPSDFGPVAFYYNEPLLAKHKIKPPATWAEFADTATKLHQADPKAFLVNFGPSDLQWLMELMAQAGAAPFGYAGGDQLTINWIGPAQLRFADYWQKLIDAKVVSTVTATSTQVPINRDKGLVAAGLDSAWAPSYFAPNAKNSMGDWRAAPIPQWTAGAGVNTDWGGSTYPVFAQSKHPAEAAQFAQWLTATDEAWNILKTPPSSLFPAYSPLLNSDSFTKITYPVSGSSHPNEVFAKAAENMAPVQWPPFMIQALNQANTTFGQVETGKQTLRQAFQAYQGQMVKYAQQQGFKVSTS
jgi:multiple sugar transport system substrate-binding protein